MELPELQLPEPLEPPKEVLDEEDQHDLFVECYDFITQVLDRKNPLWMQSEGLKLLKRLEVTLSWHKIQ
jgi:hypothetical protein